MALSMIKALEIQDRISLYNLEMVQVLSKRSKVAKALSLM